MVHSDLPPAPTAHASVNLSFSKVLQYPTGTDLSSAVPSYVPFVEDTRPGLQLYTQTSLSVPPPLYSPSSPDTEFLSQESQDSTPSPTDVSGLPVPTYSTAVAEASATAAGEGSSPRTLLPDPGYCFPEPTTPTSPRSRSRSRTASSSSAHTIDARFALTHPYARLYTKRDGTKRRKMWNHALEKALFSPQEISTMGAPHRRTIYTASLEAHVDRLHQQLLDYALFPVPFEKLDPFRGLNSKTAKSMVAGLWRDSAEMKMKLLELERSSRTLRKMLVAPSGSQTPAADASQGGMRRHSLGAAT